ARHGDLRPASGRAAEVDDARARAQDVEAVIELLQLEGGARAIAQAPGLADIGVVQLALEPLPRGRLALARGLDAHRRRARDARRLAAAPARPLTARPRHSGSRSAVEQPEQDAFANAAIGDAQPPDRPGEADRFEDGAARENHVRALAADAGMSDALLIAHRGKARRNALHMLEAQDRAVDEAAVVARQLQMNAGERRHRSRAAEHLHVAAGDLRADTMARLEWQDRRAHLG